MTYTLNFLSKNKEEKQHGFIHTLILLYKLLQSKKIKEMYFNIGNMYRTGTVTLDVQSVHNELYIE